VTSRRSAQSGFTLLEVLLALALMSVVAVALFASLNAAFKAKRGAEAALDLMREGETAMEMIRADLENALPPRGDLASEFNGRDWAGDRGQDDDDLTYYTAAPAPPTVVKAPEIKMVEMIVATLQDTGEKVLARRVTSNLLSTTLLEPDDEILCRNIAGFNLAYYDGTTWLNSWDAATEENALPVAIEVTLDIDPPQSRIDAGNPTPLRFTRIIFMPCNGKVDDSEQPAEEGEEGETGTGIESGTGATGGSGTTGGMR
jgi:type II secretion system protein J